MTTISPDGAREPTLKDLAEEAVTARSGDATEEQGGVEPEQSFLISVNAKGLELLTNALYHGSIPAEQLYAEHDDLARAIDLADPAVPDPRPDLIKHPPRYTAHPSGVECIDITEHMNFCLGNAVKYIWRAALKDDQLADLDKARWYIEREIARLEPAR